MYINRSKRPYSLPFISCWYKFIFPFMDFTYVSYSAPVPKPLMLLLQFIDTIGYCISAALYHLGLYPSFQMHPSPWDDHAIFGVAAGHLLSPSPPVSPSALKGRLPVVEYRQFAKKPGRGCYRGDQPSCAVCLNGFRLKDEVRELGNCCHVFHKRCIDQWIDRGKVSCPLCRLEMLPAKGKGSLFLNLVKKLW